MPEKKMRLEKLTISLLKDDLGRADVLREGSAVTGHRIASIDAEQDSLFTDGVPLHPAKWTPYLDPHTQSDLKAILFSASASAEIASRACAPMSSSTV